MKQRITAKSGKITRYQARVDQFRQDRLFRANQSRFYDELNGGERNEIRPEKEGTMEFWKDIWSKPTQHKENTEWLHDLKEEIKTERQNDVVITREKVEKVVNEMPNWKSPGPDLVQGFWLKRFTNLHERITMQLNECLRKGIVPKWMTKGRTILIIKDPQKGSVPSNYRPITCLAMCWKSLTGILAGEICSFMENQNALPEEQKGSRKGCRGCLDLLYIDKKIMKEVKQRKKNIAMCWLDYRNAFDLVPHSWLNECLSMFGVAENVKDLLINSMKEWSTMLTSCGEEVGEVKFSRGFFQGDSLSPLMFVIAMIPLTLVLRKMKASYKFNSNGEQINHLMFMDDIKLYAKNESGLDALVQSVRIVSNDIGMEFGVEKCAMLVIKRGKVVESNGIDLPNNETIKSIHEENGYKYLGVMEANQVLSGQMKERLRKEYKRRVKKILKSKLNGGSTITAINTWAVSMMRYAAPFVDWRKDELKEIDRGTRKMMNMYRVLHPRDSVARLYLPRKEGGRGLVAIEDCDEIAILGLENYVQDSRERILSSARCEAGERVTEKDFQKRRREERRSELEEKALHGQFFRQTREIYDPESWGWLRDGELKKETEGIMMAAQTQSLRTNTVLFTV